MWEFAGLPRVCGVRWRPVWGRPWKLKLPSRFHGCSRQRGTLWGHEDPRGPSGPCCLAAPKCFRGDREVIHFALVATLSAIEQVRHVARAEKLGDGIGVLGHCVQNLPKAFCH